MSRPLTATTLLLAAALFVATGPLAAAEPETLPTPFTAEEIRDEWITDFRLTVKMSSPGGEHLERWTVLSWDEEGAEMESVRIDEAGNVQGEPQVARSSWTELRDHALFPADRTRREKVTRDTPLGELEGWLYTVENADAGTVSEFFFAEKLPGAPVHMRVTRDGEVLTEMTQIERHRP